MWAQTADLAVTGARIYPVTPARAVFSALAVKDGKILAAGNDVSRHIGPRTKVIDAKGATIIPGFIDSHGHMQSLGDSLETLDLRGAKSAAEVASAVDRAGRDRAPGEWIRGRAWDQTAWPGRKFPAAKELPSHHPVFLVRVDGHAAWVNQKALDLADINTATPDPAGGRILRDSAGAPTGILIDRAQDLVSRHIPGAAVSQVRRRIERAAQECARLGLTSVHDAGVRSEDIAAYRALIAEKKLPLRIYAMIGGEGALWREFLQRGAEVGDRLTVRGIKLMADGALGSYGAALLAPYSDQPSNSGLLILPKSDIERVASAAVAHGFQVATHAIGDRAIRTVLAAYAAALSGPNDHRFRVEHAQVVAVEDIPLFAKYSVIASLQTTHATSDMRWAEDRLGPRRILGAYAWQRFLAAGVKISNGSDFPVESPNPLWGFYAAVTRQDHDGQPAGGWFPDQRMTREEALRSGTLDAAYAAFEEKTKGSIEPGKLADFVMLSRDIMTAAGADILKTHVRMTVVGGEIVYTE